MNIFSMALRMLKRDLRQGEWTILLTALLIAVTSSTAIGVFVDRLHKTMNRQAADFLAADLVIASSERLPPASQDKAAALSLDHAMTAEFSSVLIENDEMLLAGIKAVSAHYPLRGYLKTIADDYQQETVRRSGPAPGEAWVEKRILAALKLELGDRLRVGEKALTVTQLISYEPDKRGDLYSLSPRVMIHLDDLAATQILQPGSHVHYFFQFSGSQQAIVQFSRWLKPQLMPSQRLMDIHEDRPELGEALTRAERYLGLSSIVVVVIAGVAIAMATARYTTRQFDATAILRCLGLKQRQLMAVYLTQFAIAGLTTCVVGLVLGGIGQIFLFHGLRNLLPAQLAAPSPYALVFGLLTGLAILFGFALPPLLRLKRVAPLRVLRRDLEPLPTAAWAVYGSALLLIGILVWRYTQDIRMTAVMLGGGAALTGLFGILVYGALIQCRRMIAGLPLNWRFGLQNLLRQPQATTSQILGFSITLLAMLISLTVRSDLLDDWQRQLPDQAPNHFALNIFPDQLAPLQQSFAENSITDTRFYPIVRGRLVAINGIAVQQIVSKESQGERAIHRDLSLTWGEKLPDDNPLTAGDWSPQQPGFVSVEAKLAESLKIKLRDTLTFTLGSEQITAVVNSLRTVKWDTMKPNFYMYFSPGTLEAFPRTYLTSFYLADERKNTLNHLIKRFPNVTVLEVDLILKQFKTILAQLTAAINYLLYFALLAGFTVLFAAIYSTLDRRIHEGALMRTLGAPRRLLKKAQYVEFSILGLTSSALAIMLSEILLYILYTAVLHLDYQPHYPRWLGTLVIGAGFVTAAGLWGVKDIIKHPPMRILREQ